MSQLIKVGAPDSPPGERGGFPPRALRRPGHNHGIELSLGIHSQEYGAWRALLVPFPGEGRHQVQVRVRGRQRVVEFRQDGTARPPGQVCRCLGPLTGLLLSLSGPEDGLVVPVKKGRAPVGVSCPECGEPGAQVFVSSAVPLPARNRRTSRAVSGSANTTPASARRSDRQASIWFTLRSAMVARDSSARR